MYPGDGLIYSAGESAQESGEDSAEESAEESDEEPAQDSTDDAVHSDSERWSNRAHPDHAL